MMVRYVKYIDIGNDIWWLEYLFNETMIIVEYRRMKKSHWFLQNGKSSQIIRKESFIESNNEYKEFQRNHKNPKWNPIIKNISKKSQETLEEFGIIP